MCVITSHLISSPVTDLAKTGGEQLFSANKAPVYVYRPGTCCAGVMVAVVEGGAEFMGRAKA